MDILYCSYCGGPLRESNEYGTRHCVCTNCERRFYNNPVPSVGALLMNTQQQVLLVLRKYPPHANTWDVPGGFFDIDETAEEALLRELNEELSIAPKRLLYVGSAHDRYDFGKRNYHTISLLFAGIFDTQAPSISDEISDASWFDMHSIPYEKISFPNLTTLIRTVVDKKLYAPLFT